MTTTAKLCLVFDIDETLVHSMFDRIKISDFLLHKDATYYDQNKLAYVPFDKSFVAIFRKGLREFLDYIKSKNGEIALAIWTYGNDMYAHTIVDGLSAVFGYEGPYEFIYTDKEIREDLENEMFEKDLRRVFRATPFTHTNTILIDNRPANIFHDANYQNGFIVESFIPTNNKYSIDRDYLFDDLQHICEQFLANPPVNDYVFSEKNTTAMKLTPYMRMFKVPTESAPRQIMSMNNVDEDNDFFFVKPFGKKGGKKKTGKYKQKTFRKRLSRRLQ